MTQPSPTAGGFFLVASILAGFGIGVARGQAMAGILVGVGVGTVVALLTWWLDRRRLGR